MRSILEFLFLPFPSSSLQASRLPTSLHAGLEETQVRDRGIFDRGRRECYFLFGEVFFLRGFKNDGGAASSLKKPALPKPSAIPATSLTEEVEVESSLELMKRKKKKTETKELEPTSVKVGQSDPSPSGRREDVPTTQARVIPESEMT